MSTVVSAVRNEGKMTETFFQCASIHHLFYLLDLSCEERGCLVGPHCLIGPHSFVFFFSCSFIFSCFFENVTVPCFIVRLFFFAPLFVALLAWIARL